jgi:hypothetical protein
VPAKEAPEAQEVDVWMGAYSGRALWPSFLACGLLTAALAGGAWYLWAVHQADPFLMKYLVYALATALWLYQLGRWAYRTVSRTYRLTTRHLYRDRGFQYPADGSVALSRVAAVRVDRTPLERLIGVGRVRVSVEGQPEALVLEGVYDPERVAHLIRETVRHARGARP